MTLYYAVGGGLGHQTRARRVLATLGLKDAEVLTSLDLPPELEGRPDEHRTWLRERLRGRHVIVDAFPAGIQGELSGIEEVTFDHVARRLQWDAYRSVVPKAPPRFATTYIVEPLSPSHEHFLRGHSSRLVELTLSGELASRSSLPPQDPFALIVHSGPANEVEELLAYARELGRERLVVATRCDMSVPRDCERVHTDQPSEYFEAATRIVSGAGFNVMSETEPWRHKHWPFPFPRRFDDQYWRAARRRAWNESRPLTQALTAPSASSSAQRA